MPIHPWSRVDYLNSIDLYDSLRRLGDLYEREAQSRKRDLGTFTGSLKDGIETKIDLWVVSGSLKLYVEDNCLHVDVHAKVRIDEFYHQDHIKLICRSMAKSTEQDIGVRHMGVATCSPV